ncbi:MAG: hypothetical protein R2788_06960 [Saprospiraceae bacterium]
MHTIKILGVRDHIGTNLLYSNVQNALLGLNLRLDPALVEDVDKLMDYKVGGIPALVVRGQVVSQRYIPDENSLQHFFRTIFLPEKNPVKMNNILIPTDFSETSKNAFDCRAVAARAKATVKVCISITQRSVLGRSSGYVQALKWKQENKVLAKVDAYTCRNDDRVF